MVPLPWTLGADGPGPRWCGAHSYLAKGRLGGPFPSRAGCGPNPKHSDIQLLGRPGRANDGTSDTLFRTHRLGVVPPVPVPAGHEGVGSVCFTPKVSGDLRGVGGLGVARAGTGGHHGGVGGQRRSLGVGPLPRPFPRPEEGWGRPEYRVPVRLVTNVKFLTYHKG